MVKMERTEKMETKVLMVQKDKTEKMVKLPILETMEIGGLVTKILI